MGILLAFAPFVVFAVIEQFFGAMPGLITAALMSGALLSRTWMRPHGSPKVLEVGTVVLFGGLAIYAALGGLTGSVFVVRLCVDAGLLIIVLASIALRRPFTIQYAREQVPRDVWSRPEFTRANDIISTVWALAFVVLVAADVILVYAPRLPPAVGIGVTVAALLGAAKFTSWYPKRKAHEYSRT